MSGRSHTAFRRFLPYTVVGILLVVIAFFLFRSPNDSRKALSEFTQAMLGAKSLGCAKISNGPLLLTDEQALAVMEQLVTPLYAGATLVELKAERRGPGHSSAQNQLRLKDGKLLFIAMNAFDLEGGGAFPLYMMLEKFWQAPVVAELGRYPQSESAFTKVYIEGWKSAAPKLREIGIAEVFGPQGKFMSPEQIIALLEAQSLESKN